MPGTTSPNWQLKGAIGEAMDQLNRRRAQRNVRRQGSSSGGANPATPPPGATDVSQRTVLNIADAGSATVDLGLAADYTMFSISPCWMRRNFATPAIRVDHYDIVHDGVNAYFASRREGRMPPNTDLGVTPSLAISSGMVQLTFTASNATPDATADVILVITPVEAL